MGLDAVWVLPDWLLMVLNLRVWAVPVQLHGLGWVSSPEEEGGRERLGQADPSDWRRTVGSVPCRNHAVWVQEGAGQMDKWHVPARHIPDTDRDWPFRMGLGVGRLGFVGLWEWQGRARLGFWRGVGCGLWERQGQLVYVGGFPPPFTL